MSLDNYLKQESIADVLDASWLSYYASKNSDRVYGSFKKVLSFGDFHIGVSSSLPISTADCDSCKCIVLGLCVDSHGEIERSQVAAYLLSGNLVEVQEKLNRLAGCFIVIIQTNVSSYVFTDACAMLPCFHATTGDFSSSDYLLAQCNGFVEGGSSAAMRRSSPIGKSLPYTYTSFEEVKALLPNHFLDLYIGSVTRYSPYPLSYYERLREGELPEAVQQLVRLADTTLAEYRKALPGEPVAALTAGWDSRLNYAVLKRSHPNCSAFTFVHGGFTDATPDIEVPRSLCDRLSQKHVFLEDQHAPESVVRQIDQVYGPYFDPSTTIDLAYTFRLAFPDGYLLSGHVIDGIGKNHVCNATPLKMTSPTFFQEKTYCSAPEGRKASSEWLEDVKQAGDEIMSCDLFSIENRIARWVTQATQLYSYLSLPVVDVFNCHETIELMMRVPRSQRAKCAIHKEFFRQTAPNLLEDRFNGMGPIATKINTSWQYSFLKARAKRIASQTCKKNGRNRHDEEFA